MQINPLFVQIIDFFVSCFLVQVNSINHLRILQLKKLKVNEEIWVMKSELTLLRSPATHNYMS